VVSALDLKPGDLSSNLSHGTLANLQHPWARSLLSDARSTKPFSHPGSMNYQLPATEVLLESSVVPTLDDAENFFFYKNTA
jgi:hypothetical protein